MSGFRSANLKMIFEELREMGYPISASQAGKLFRDDELECLLSEARSYWNRVETLVTRIETITRTRDAFDEGSYFWLIWNRDIERLQAKLDDIREDWDPRELWD